MKRQQRAGISRRPSSNRVLHSEQTQHSIFSKDMVSDVTTKYLDMQHMSNSRSPRSVVQSGPAAWHDAAAYISSLASYRVVTCDKEGNRSAPRGRAMELCLGEEDAYLNLAERTYARAAKQRKHRDTRISPCRIQRCNELDLNLIVR